jgi:hypothetical protein
MKLGVVVLGLSLVAGCADQALPGTMLGTFAVSGKPTANTCGAGLEAPDPWNFHVQLSKSGTTLHWGWIDGKPPVSGTLDAARTATISASQISNVDGTAKGAGTCDMRRTDTLTVTLDEDERAFHGTLAYEFRQVDGAVCENQLAAQGGQYATLPCSVTYSMSATEK